MRENSLILINNTNNTELHWFSIKNFFQLGKAQKPEEGEIINFTKPFGKPDSRKSKEKRSKNVSMHCLYIAFIIHIPAGKFAGKAVWHCILNADSTKTHSSSVTF